MPKKYHDIVLDSTIKKDYLKTNNVLSLVFADKDNIKNFNKSQIINPTQIEQKQNSILGKFYYFEDSEDIIFKSTDLLYTRSNISKNIGIGVDAGIFSIEKKNINKYNGSRYGVSLLWNHFSLRLGLNKFDDFNEFTPSLAYNNKYKNHSYSIQYTHQNAMFYTYSLCPYEKRINSNDISISDYIQLRDNNDLWANLEFNAYSNNDKELTAQYDWRFFNHIMFNEKSSYRLALEGWYTTHSKQNSCFYSPKFSDSTLVRFDPKYTFSKYIGIKGTFGIGYSFSDKIDPYKYGLTIFGKPLESFSYNLGCIYSNASRPTSGPSYHYKECKINLEYKW